MEEKFCDELQEDCVSLIIYIQQEWQHKIQVCRLSQRKKANQQYRDGERRAAS